ncbi:LuxR C-terminal-related transcriptional regulator, partial [Paramagnetospirillum caucaseum]
MSQETVKIHISAILRKLGASSRAQAVMMAHQM